jgi:L-fucose isomerase-like protein
MNDLRENLDDYECYLFCLKHLEIGKRELKNGGKDRIKQGSIDHCKSVAKFTGERVANAGSKTRGGRAKKVPENEDEEVNEKDLESDVEEEDDDEEGDEVPEGEEKEVREGNRRKVKLTRKAKATNKKNQVALKINNR